jgi:hypothetical protein
MCLCSHLNWYALSIKSVKVELLFEVIIFMCCEVPLTTPTTTTHTHTHTHMHMHMHMHNRA